MKYAEAGNILSAVVKERGYDTLTDFSKAVKIAKTTMGSILNGVFSPSPTLAYKLFEFLDIPEQLREQMVDCWGETIFDKADAWDRVAIGLTPYESGAGMGPNVEPEDGENEEADEEDETGELNPSAIKTPPEPPK